MSTNKSTLPLRIKITKNYQQSHNTTSTGKASWKGKYIYLHHFKVAQISTKPHKNKSPNPNLDKNLCASHLCLLTSFMHKFSTSKLIQLVDNRNPSTKAQWKTTITAQRKTTTADKRNPKHKSRWANARA